MSNYRDKIYGAYASNFKNTGPLFDERAAKRWARAFDYYLRDWIPPDRQIMIADLACGDGKALHFFKTRGYLNLAGVDISTEQVELARQVLATVDHCDVLDFLKSEKESFDLLLGFDIIEHLKKDEVLLFLSRCFTRLSAGGRLILQTPNADSPLSSTVRYGDFTHETCFTPEVLRQLMRAAGFTAIRIRELGPPPLGYGFLSSGRYLIWQFFRAFVKLWNLSETGSSGCGVLTRVFLITGVKP